ncbi:MAG: STAS-like domain-containing protein [Bryobacteraceae bacterium]
MPTVESPQEAIKHSISTEFSRTPGPRFAKEGSFSGEEFRNLFLSKWFEEATAAGVKLAIDFDGVYGYAPSFIEEAFGGLARIHGSDAVQQILELNSSEDPYIVERVRGVVAKANA